MAAIPQTITSKSVEAIYAYYEAKAEKRRSRRLGASIVGKECPRSIWLDFRWAGQEEFEGRMIRLFQTGHLEELRFVSDLRGIGCEVHEVDPATGQQFEFTDCGGHLVCKIDAAVCGLPEAAKAWHCGEFKTHGSKSFSGLLKDGLKKSKPQHYAQLIIGMALSGMERGYYLAVNKDTDALFSDRLRWEEVKPEAERLRAFALTIIESKEPPAKIANTGDDFRCQFCSHKEICHGDAVADITCRSCLHSTPLTSGDLGQWRCEKHNKILSVTEQEKACEDHLFIPDLIPFAQPNDSGNDPGGDWVEYVNTDGTRWKNGKQPNHYKSVELKVLPAVLVGAGTVETVKQTIGAEVVEFEKAGAT